MRIATPQSLTRKLTWKRFPQVAVDSSAAKIPLPGATIALAMRCNSAWSSFG
jgi:hypothetical protein